MEQQSLRTDDCIEKVIKHYSDMVYRLAFARTGTKHDADDVFQEVFIRYLKVTPNFKDEEHRKAWLLRVTVNCSNSFLSSPWRTRTNELPEGLTVEDDDIRDLQEELLKLSKKHREVIHLYYYEGFTTKEIAKTLGRKESTVRTQLTRARAELKTFMEEDDYV